MYISQEAGEQEAIIIMERPQEDSEEGEEDLQLMPIMLLQVQPIPVAEGEEERQDLMETNGTQN